jgi:hypothetical protein
VRDDEAVLTEAIIRLAKQHGRYGYRRIREMLIAEGWRVSVKRAYRIWRREGLKVPKKQPKRGRLWLNDGSCIRLRPENFLWWSMKAKQNVDEGAGHAVSMVRAHHLGDCNALLRYPCALSMPADKRIRSRKRSEGGPALRGAHVAL